MDQIEKAVKVLKSGGIIAYPTDTVYGLGANIFNDDAVHRVFELKGRDFKKPLSVAVTSFEMLEESAVVSLSAHKIIHHLLPGPITIILPKKPAISDLVTADQQTVAIRYPDHDLALEIIKQADFPITATSANLAGEKAVFRSRDIKLNIDFVVGGECKYKQPSTIVNLSSRTVIRAGAGSKKVKKLLNLP